MTTTATNSFDPSPAILPPPHAVATPRGPVELRIFGQGPPVLCLHGAMGGYDQSSILARTLGEPGYRYIALSRPGYLGTSFKCGRTPEEQADLYAAVLDALGVDRAAVMAVSGGGPSAIHFALRHADRCWALVLVSTCAEKANNRLPFSYKMMKVLTRIPPVARAMQKKAARNPDSMAQRSITNAALFERTRQNTEAWALLRELQASTLDRMALRLAGTENDVEVVTRTRTYPLEKIAVPTLVVHGTADPFVPFDVHGRGLATRVPGAELAALEGGEHAAIFSHRDEARLRVTQFLRRHAPATTTTSMATTTSHAV